MNKPSERLFDDMSFTEKLDHIERCQKSALEAIKNGEPSHLADIADHVDLWGALDAWADTRQGQGNG